MHRVPNDQTLDTTYYGNTASSLPAKFLCNLPKNLTMHLTHKLCTVLPYQLYHNRTGIATDFLVKIT
ncbi:hypothetical protein DXB92_01325 [Ruminococcus sp. OM06-36AC]|nr:hypothetical protein DXB92_01325 [Ruminococcus sp. OM06-36AC]